MEGVEKGEYSEERGSTRNPDAEKILLGQLQ